MLIILIRTMILYFVVLFVIRVMGKAELSKMDPFEMIILFMIAELAAIPIESLDIPLLPAVDPGTGNRNKKKNPGYGKGDDTGKRNR
jgi:uncharacterized membrane protein YcaP (DUF421 family)